MPSTEDFLNKYDTKGKPEANSTEDFLNAYTPVAGAKPAAAPKPSKMDAYVKQQLGQAPRSKTQMAGEVVRKATTPGFAGLSRLMPGMEQFERGLTMGGTDFAGALAGAIGAPGNPIEAFDKLRAGQMASQGREGTLQKGAEAAGGIASLAAPIGVAGKTTGALKEAPLIERVIAGAKSAALPGAAQGAAAGLFGAKDAKSAPLDTALGGMGGLVLGGALGGAAPAVSALGGAIKKGADYLSGGKLLNQQKRAGETLLQAITKAETTPSLLAAEQAAKQKAGAKVSALDVLPPEARAKARTASTASGKAQTQLETYAKGVEKQRGEVGRQAVKTLPTPRTAAEHVQTYRDLRASRAEKLYGKDFMTSVDVTPVIDTLSTPAGQRALREVATTLANEAGGQGPRALQAKEVMKDLPDLIALVKAKAASSPEEWAAQMAKEGGVTAKGGLLTRLETALKEAGDRKYVAGEAQSGSAIKELAGTIGQALDQTPSLQAARADYRKWSEVIRAPEAGAEAVTNPERAADAIRAFNGMTKEARRGFRAGMKEALEAEIARNPNAFLNRMAKDSEGGLRQTLETAFDPETADRFFRKAEYQLERMEKASAASGLSYGNEPGPGILEAAKSPMVAAGQALKKGAIGMTRGEAEGISSLATSEDPSALAALAKLSKQDTGIVGRVVPGAAAQVVSRRNRKKGESK